MDWLDTLNSAQRMAVTTTDGPLLIVAGPGSGKTRVIVHRIAYLIDGIGVDPYNVLAMTFTNKAAREMRDRLDALLGAGRTRYLTVGTFHATCARWLRIDGSRLGLDPRFAILDDADQIDLVKRAMRELEIDDKRYSARSVLSAISGAKSELITPEQFAARAQGLWQQVVAKLYARYGEMLAENRALDFDDLLGWVVELFRSCPDVLERYQERYRYLMVDEFQDTNVTQYQLISLLGKKYRNLCVVGDEDQSIYGWRKADIRNIVNFERDFPELKIVMLEQNYRSTQTILDVAGAVIAPNLGRKPKRLWTDNPKGVPVVLHEAYDERDEALFVVRQVEALRRAGATYSDVAVTYRTNAQSRAIEDAFVRYAVPYRLIGGTRFYQRREVKDVLGYLRLLANPADGVSFLRIANVPTRGVGQKTMSELQAWSARLAKPLFEVAKLAADGTEEIDPASNRIRPVVPMATRPRTILGEFVKTIEQARERLGSAPLSDTLTDLLAKIGYEQYLRDGTEEGDERWQNVQELWVRLRDFDQLPGDEALESFLEAAALVQDVDSLEEGQSDAVTLITLHAAKGLEFPVVFILGLEEGICPHARSVDTREQLEEERRLLYVGVTRAMRALFLVHAFRRTTYGSEALSSPSRFLQDIPAHLLDTSFSRAVGGANRGTSAVGGWGQQSAGRMSRSASGGPDRGVASRHLPWSDAPLTRRAADPYASLDTRDVDSDVSPADDLAPADDPTPGDSGSTGRGDDRRSAGRSVSHTSWQPDTAGAARTPAARPASPVDRPSVSKAARTPSFGRGERVTHAEYGIGTIVASSFAGSEELALVRFDVRPDKPKNLSLSIHRLERA
ncbi:MAG: UvrD-helicase domain-containing protein [Chloroflexi bacterium]|nr:UvrD-helicase domain-containing protein [Chloroflexota bacterium]